VSVAGASSPSRSLLRFGRRRAVLEVTRALAALLPAGMPLSRALATSAHVAAGDLAEVLEAVRARVERGQSLAVALAEHPDYFPSLYVGMVRAGERSGDLAAAFVRLTDQLERQDQLRARLLSASIYPLLLALVGGVAMVVLLLFVLPRFAELLAGAGATLPRSTAMLLAASEGLQRYWPALFLIPLLAGAGVVACRSAGRGGSLAAMLLLRVPLVGRLRRTLLAARFARVTGVLLGGGAPLLVALTEAVHSLDDPLARSETERIRDRVREGRPLHGAIAEGPLYPPLLARLVAVGEESSRLQEFLLKAAELFEDRAERALHRLVTLAEPAMIVGFGVVVAIVALSLLQAIYSVNAGAFP
jgi:type II secretory pathway component PulF